MESFFKTLKVERIYEVLSGVNYNRRRRQLKLPPYAATGADAVGLAPAAFAR